MNKKHNRLRLSRRDFLKLTGTAGAGLVLAVYMDACGPATATPEIAIVTPTDSTPTLVRLLTGSPTFISSWITKVSLLSSLFDPRWDRAFARL